jgi:hypothetical protein
MIILWYGDTQHFGSSGLTAEFRLDENCSRGYWHMLASPDDKKETVEIMPVRKDTPYVITGKVQDLSGGKTIYRVIIREKENDESAWDLEWTRPKAGSPSGSAFK